MSTRIRQNLLSISSQRFIRQSLDNVNTAITRLSTGLRINNAWDDPAGLNMSERFRAQVSSLHEAERNAEYAINMLRTADGAMQVIDEKLVRLRSLAVQASNGVLSREDRRALHMEFDQIRSEIERIAASTRYNGIYPLSYTRGIGAVIPRGDEDLLVNTTPVDLTLFDNGVYDGDRVRIDLNNRVVAEDVTLDVAPGVVIPLHLSAGINDLTITALNMGDLEPNTATFSVSDVVQGPPTQSWGLRTGESITYKLFLDSTATETSEAETFPVKPPPIKFHIGTNNEYGVDYYFIERADMTVDSLGLTGLNILDTLSAQNAITEIDEAINSKDMARNRYGALANRLQNTIQFLMLSRESSVATESMIRDTDVAHEYSEMTRNQIKAQAGMAMLSQANMIPQVVAQLIG